MIRDEHQCFFIFAIARLVFYHLGREFEKILGYFLSFSGNDVISKKIQFATRLDGLSKEMCIASYLIAKRIVQLGKKSGWLFVALY